MGIMSKADQVAHYRLGVDQFGVQNYVTCSGKGSRAAARCLNEAKQARLSLDGMATKYAAMIGD